MSSSSPPSSASSSCSSGDDGVGDILDVSDGCGAVSSESAAREISVGDGLVVLPGAGGAGGASRSSGKLNPLALVSVTYFLVCGGAYGTEDLGGSIPPLFALLGLLLIPWVWSFPIAMMTAELATAMPEEGAGYLAWLARGLGPSWSFVDTYITASVVMFDLALYPLIFTSYVSHAVPMSAPAQYFLSLAVVLFCFLINVCGAASFGSSSQIFSLLAIAPFVVFSLCAFFAPEFHADRWFSTETFSPEAAASAYADHDALIPGWNFGLYFSVLVWATCGYEYSGFLVNETKKPAKNFPRVLVACVLLMTATYVFPVAVAIAVQPKDFWLTEGAYPVIARKGLKVGPWLLWVMTAGGLGSSAGTYNAYLHTGAAALAAQAEKGDFPPFFRRSLPAKKLGSFTLFGTPVVGLAFYTMTTCILILFEFEFVVMVEAALYVIHVLLLNANFVYMRFATKRGCKDMPRRFRVKIGTCDDSLAILCAALPSICAVVELVAAGWLVDLVALGVIAFIATCYFIKRCIERRT